MPTEIVLTIAIVLVAMTLLGHGIWVLLASLVRLITGPTAARTPETACPVCRTPKHSDAVECPACGWSRPTDASDAPRRIATRQIIDLRFRKLIDDATFQHVMDAFGRLDSSSTGYAPPSSTAGTTPETTGAEPSPPKPSSPEPSPPDVAIPDAVTLQRDQVAPPTQRDAPARDKQIVMAEVVDSATERERPTPTPARPADVAERAREYARKRARPEPLAPPPQRAPRKPWSEVFAAFMEEKHIRWGELVGGLLIVSCSIALVISFWSQIANQPLLKFGLFNGVTAALFAVGLHAAKRWKLPTTAQGLLITAMLLTPLNFLAIAAFAEGSAPSSPLAYVGEVVSLIGFATLTFFAARVVVADWPVVVTAAILAQCLAELLIRRLVTPDTTLFTLYAITVGSLFAYTATNAWSLHRTRADDSISADRGNDLFKMLGVSTFAACLPLGLLLFKTQSILPNLRWLAPLAGLAALPSLGSGLLVWRRAERRLPGLRTAGTSIAIGGAAVLVAGLALSWPQPATMLPSAAMIWLVLTAIAIWFGIPESHLPAGAGAALTYLIACLLLADRIAWRVDRPTELWQALSSGFSGNALTGLVVGFGLAASGYAWLRRDADGRMHGILAAVTGIASLALITWRGFAVSGDPLGATWTYGLYAALALAVAYFARQPLLTAAGGGLLLAALVQGLVYWYGSQLQWQQPWIATLLLHAIIVAAGAAATQRLGLDTLSAGGTPLERPSSLWGRPANRRPYLAEPLQGWALLTSALGVMLMFVRAAADGVRPAATYMSAAAVAWLIVAAIRQSRALFSLFQLALAASLVFAVDQQLASRTWYIEAPRGWLHPYTWQAWGIAVALLSLAWLALRAVLRRWGAGPDAVVGKEMGKGWQAPTAWLLYPTWPRVDSLATTAVVGLLVLMSVYAVVPGVAQELSPRTDFTRIRTEVAGDSARVVPAADLFTLDRIPHQPARGWGAWWLAGVLAVVLTSGLREKFEFAKLSGLALVAASASLLLAARWDAQVAAASALRWYTAGLFGLGSVLIWCRKPLPRVTGARHWPGARGKPALLSRRSFLFLVFLAVAPLLGMALFVALAAVSLTPPSAEQVEGLQFLLGLATVALVLWLVSQYFEQWFASGTAWPNRLAPSVRQGGSVLLVLGAAPLLAMSLFVVANALMRHPVVGPDPASFFARVGLSASYALPMLLIAVSLVGHAIHQRSAGLALTSGLVLNFCASAAYLLSGVGAMDAQTWLRLAQLNAIVSGGFALGWILYLVRGQGRNKAFARRELPNALPTQVGFAGGFAGLFIVPVTMALFLNPNAAFDWPKAAGLWGWSAVALVATAGTLLCMLARPRGEPTRRLPFAVLAAPLLAAIPLLACEVDRWDVLRNWWAYHTLLALSLCVGYALWGASVALRGLDARFAAGWTSLPLTGAILLAVRAIFDDPGMPWWSVSGLLGAAVLSALLAGSARRQRFVYLAGVLGNLAASIWWIDEGYRQWGGDGIAVLFEFVQLNVIVLALPVVVWMWLDRRWIGRRSGPSHVLSFHRLAAAAALYLLLASVALSLFSDAVGESVAPRPAFGWSALFAVLIGIGACLWDPRARWSVAGLYIAGLASVAMFVDQFDLPLDQLIWTGAMALAAYAVATSYLWSRRRGLAELARRLRMPRSTDDPMAGQRWLAPANQLLAAGVIVLGYWSQFVLADLSMRIAAAQAVLAQALAMGMLARGARESQLRVRALWLGVVGAVAFGWAWLDPGGTGNFLNRSVFVSVALAGMAVLYGLGLSKVIRRENAWTRAAQNLVPSLAVIALISITVVMTAEVLLYTTTGAAEMIWPAIVAVALTLVGLAGACLVAAVVPGRDPMGWSERQRTAYVYAAEVMLALLFLHVRLTMPWLFSGFFQQFWPLLVMLIAFLGVGLSEWFRRREQRVLAEPLERSGVLLPMLPVLGYWAAPTQVHFSLLMLTVGMLYGGLSALRRSFGFGILAALAVNGGLWYLLQHTEGLGILEHPQIWLIPPALCVLVAAYLNRDNLSEAQMTSVRYLTATVVYTASTADIFLNGVAQAPWLPLVLAGLSIVGVLVGIMLRVRAFLFLGTAFLVLALFTMIWYAAVDLEQTWLWFLAGIVAGVLIIAVFAIFEKKRQRILDLMDQLKQWDA